MRSFHSRCSTVICCAVSSKAYSSYAVSFSRGEEQGCVERCIMALRGVRDLPAFFPFITWERMRRRSTDPMSDPGTNCRIMPGSSHGKLRK